MSLQTQRFRLGITRLPYMQGSARLAEGQLNYQLYHQLLMPVAAVSCHQLLNLLYVTCVPLTEGDKTFFIAALLAMKLGRTVSFVGGSLVMRCSVHVPALSPETDSLGRKHGEWLLSERSNEGPNGHQQLRD